MKYLFTVFAVVLFSLNVFAQTAVTKIDSAKVYSNASTSSNLLDHLPIYTEIEVLEKLQEGWIKSQYGWIEGKYLITKKALSEKGIHLESSAIEYSLNDSLTTEAQLLKDLIAEERKNQQIRDDVRTMKNITVGMLVVSIVVSVASVAIFVLK